MPISEFDTRNDSWQLIFAIKTPQGFLGSLEKLEYPDQRCFSSQTPFGSFGSVSKVAKVLSIGNVDMLPVLCCKVIKG